MRPKEDNRPRLFDQHKVEEIHAMLRSLGWSEDKILIQTKIYAALFDSPELNMPTMIPLETFCVVVMDSDKSGHGYGVGEPVIVTFAANRICLHTDGCVNHWSFHLSDKPRLATDEEIQICIESLTDKQWYTIRCHEFFKPVMDAAMAQAVTVDMEPVMGKDSEEHTLPDGRKITVDAE